MSIPGQNTVGAVFKSALQLNLCCNEVHTKFNIMAIKSSLIYSLPFQNFQHRPPLHTSSAKEALMIRYKINKLMILQFNKSVTSGLDAPFDKCKIYLSNRLINASKSKQSLRAVQWNLCCIVCKCALIMMINGHLSAF